MSYDFKFLESDALSITPKLTVFASAHFQDAQVQGTVYSDEIQGALEVDYYFSKDERFYWVEDGIMQYSNREALLEGIEAFYPSITSVDLVVFKKAYRTLRALYHPDKINHLGGTRKQQAEEEMKLINLAWATIQRQ